MNKRIPIFLGLLTVCVAIWMLLTPTPFIQQLLERLDSLGYDLHLRTRVYAEHLKPSPVIAIVDIDDKSLAAVGRWPWVRSKLVTLINELQKQGAVVIAFDVMFSEPEHNIDKLVYEEFDKRKLLTPDLAALLNKYSDLFDIDTQFAKSLTTIPTVLAITWLPIRQTQNDLPKPALILNQIQAEQLDIPKMYGYIANIPNLQDAAYAVGFINIFPDSDGIIRHAPLLIDYNNKIFPALSLQAVMAFFGENIQLVTPVYDKTQELEGIQLGSFFIPTDARGQVLIPFIGKSYTFPYYSASDVMQGKLPPDTLLGKIVFIGTSATGLGDLKATAIENPFPGVEVQATLANGIIENRFSYIPAWTFGANFVITVAFGLLAAIIFPFLGPRILGLMVIILPPGLLLLNSYIWHKTGLILSLLLPIILLVVIALGNIIYGYLFETRRREHLKQMFGQYVPSKHIDEMLKTTSDYALRGEDREMTVLFADIRNFTTISEGMPAAELVEMLNTFFTPMTEIIFQHRGTIDKYVGDLIMAFWGAPLKDKNHARHALEAALKMRSQIIELKSIMERHHWPKIDIGVGINTGIMSVGDMGSKYRRNYTVLGDTVNLASRVEGLTKFYGVDIIVTENTQLNQSKFVFRTLDKVKVKGKQQSSFIYELICTQNDLSSELQNELEQYQLGLNAYFAKDWVNAFKIMEQLHKKFPSHKIYKIYYERLIECQTHSPPADWDGVFIHSLK